MSIYIHTTEKYHIPWLYEHIHHNTNTQLVPQTYTQIPQSYHTTHGEHHEHTIHYTTNTSASDILLSKFTSFKISIINILFRHVSLRLCPQTSISNTPQTSNPHSPHNCTAHSSETLLRYFPLKYIFLRYVSSNTLLDMSPSDIFLRHSLRHSLQT